MTKEPEWRKLPEFPAYEINELGDVRNCSTKREIKETHNKTTDSYHYPLRKRGTIRCSRSFTSLLYSAFPELLSDWVAIPDFPGYLMHRDGRVMTTYRYQEMKPEPNGVYRLRKKGRRCRWYYTDVPGEVWDQLWQEKAAA